MAESRLLPLLPHRSLPTVPPGRLSGTLLGVSSRPCLPLSVEGHVHQLIAEASDKENLGQMYIWWEGLVGGQWEALQWGPFTGEFCFFTTQEEKP